MLFKVHPLDKETVKIIWMIPDESMWNQYERGKLCENATVKESIEAFKKDRAYLEKDDPEDPSDDRAKEIYRQFYPHLFHP
jgi:hypothetical protein